MPVLSYDRSAPIAVGLRIAARAVIVLAGLALVLLALAMGRDWREAHMLPDLVVPWRLRVALVDVERVLLAAAGLALLIGVRPFVDGQLRAGRGGALLRRSVVVLGALLLALLASEALLRWVVWRDDAPWRVDRAPERVADARLGWRNAPDRAAIDPFYRSAPVYVIDGTGHRVASRARPVDYRRPAILFTGESILFGSGLNWRDTIPGRLEALTGTPAANLAVNAYATDQANQRLADELPRFAHPVAVVAIFSPSLLERNLLRNRPWRDAGGRWHAAEPEWRLQHLARFLLPFHGRAAIAEMVGRTRSALQADMALAHARGVPAVVLIPQFLPETTPEAALRHGVLDGSGIPWLRVPLDPAWRLAPDYHPDARADRAMALALARWLGSGRAPQSAAGN